MFDTAPATEAPREAREAWCKAMARRTLASMPRERVDPSYGHTGASLVGLMMAAGRPPLPLGFDRVVELAEEALAERREALGFEA